MQVLDKKYPQLKIASLLHNGHKYNQTRYQLNLVPRVIVGYLLREKAVQSQLLTEYYHKNTQLK